MHTLIVYVILILALALAISVSTSYGLIYAPSAGVKVSAMLGGAAVGSFLRLDDPSNATFALYYRPLHDFLSTYRLDGIDIDVEEHMCLFRIIRLIDNLRVDFGLDFIITLAPVADAMLHPLTNLNGLDYAEPLVRNVTTRGTIGRCINEWLILLAAVREVDAS